MQTPCFTKTCCSSECFLFGSKKALFWTFMSDHPPSQVLTQKQQCVNTPEPAVTHITFTASKYYHTASHRPQQMISNMHHLYSQRFLPDSTSQTTARDFNHIATHRPQPGILSHSILTDHCQWFLSRGTSQSTARDLYHMAPCGPQQEISIYIWHLTDHCQGLLLCWDCNTECHVPMAVLMTYE